MIGRHLAVAVTLLGVTACGAGARGPAGANVPAAEAATPGLRLPADVRPRAVAFDLALDPTQPRFAGVAWLQVELATPRRILWLNATGLTVQAASVTQGEYTVPARATAVGTEHLRIEVDAPLAAGPATIELEYSGPVPSDVNDGLYRVEDHGVYGIYTQFEAIFARRAFPSFDEPTYKVPVTLALRVPPGQTAIANTPIVREEPLPGGWRRVEFEPTRPLPIYLVAFAVGAFDVVDLGPLGTSRTPTRLIAPRGRGAELAVAREAVPRSFAIVEDWIGLPHPYPKLDLIAVPRMGGAMENAGLITFGLPILAIPHGEDTPRRRRSLVTYVIHEIAHQWFGNSVTAAWWDELWLNEAFATWIEDKLTHAYDPRWDMASEAVATRSDVMDADAQATARRIREPIVHQDDIEDAFDAITYTKGEAVLAMIEAWLGPDVFQRGVRRFLATHADASATTADFVAAIGAEAGRDVGPVLYGFVDQSGVPLLEVDLTCAAGAPPALSLTRRRYRPLGAGGPDDGGAWQLPVCVRYDRGVGASGRACTLLSAKTATLALADATSCPRWIAPNDDVVGYYRVRLADALLERALATTGGLTTRERVGLVLDLAALAEAGVVELARALAPLPALARESTRTVVEASFGLASLVDGEHTPEALRPARAAWLRELYGARARKLGLLPRAGEHDDDRLLRPELVALVGDEGEDPVLIAEAQRLAGRWIAKPEGLPADRQAQVLALAAAHGDATLFEAVLARAIAEPDRARRERLIAVLGSFRAPALVARALAEVLADRLPARESLDILWGVLGDRRTRDAGWAFVEAHLDQLVARLPKGHESLLVGIAGAFCDPEHRARAKVLLERRAQGWLNGPRAFAQTLEAVDLCIASRPKLTPQIEAFLRPGARP